MWELLWAGTKVGTLKKTALIAELEGWQVNEG